MKGLDRDGIVRRAAQELRDGMYVNLGIGIPTLVANMIPRGMEVILQSEQKARPARGYVRLIINLSDPDPNLMASQVTRDVESRPESACITL